jgi:hypothetical protein
MMQALAIAAVVLVAVLVGVAIPALLQLRRTLRAAEIFLDTTGTRLNRTLDEASQAIATVQRTSASLEGSASELRRLFDAAGSFAQSVGRAGESLRSFPTLFGAVAAAVASGVRAFGRGAADGKHEALTDEPAAATKDAAA